jgi:hypothetical protein
MNKLLIISALILAGSLNAQIRISNNLCRLKDTAVVFNHSGCPNVLTVHSDQKVKKVISVRGAKLTFDRKSQQVSYHPISKEADTLLLLVKGSWKRIPLSTVNAPQPKVYWGTNRSGKISKEKLVENEGLILTNDSIPYRFDSRIFSFRALILKQSDTLLFRRCQTDSTGEYPFGEFAAENQAVYQTLYGNSFSTCLLPQLEQLNSGDILWIPMVTFGCSSCISRKLYTNIKLMIE